MAVAADEPATIDGTRAAAGDAEPTVPADPTLFTPRPTSPDEYEFVIVEERTDSDSEGSGSDEEFATRSSPPRRTPVDSKRSVSGRQPRWQGRRRPAAPTAG